MKIVIVGGGTAGTLAALSIKTFFPEHDVTLIDSSKIGVVGVGEGTTPNFYYLIKKLKINESEMIQKTNAYFKAGFKFTNWTKDDPKSFVHPFSNNFLPKDICYDLVDAANYFDGNLDRLSEVSQSLLKNEVIDTKSEYPVFGKTTKRELLAWHIDAHLFSKYIRDIAISRGVVHIDNIVIDFDTDETTNNVTNINLENGDKVPADFVIDSSGFSRKIIGKLYNEKWISTKKYLPNDRAIPFFLNGKDPVPYSNSIAMNNGWIWEISLQSRYGCGYVFSSKHATDEEIIEEIYSRYGKENVSINKPISFDAGYYENIWVNNVLAIGLSGSFFEPLEATSIQYSLTALANFIDLYFLEYLNNKDVANVIKKFNNEMREMNESIVALINLHYVTNRDDTQYWKDIKNSYEVHPITIEVINKIKNKKDIVPSMPGNNQRLSWLHAPSSWLSIYSGNHLYEKGLVFDKKSELMYNNRIQEVENFKGSIPAKELLRKIMEK